MTDQAATLWRCGRYEPSTHGAGWGKRDKRGSGVNGIGDLLSLYVGNGLGVNSGSAQRAYQAAHQNALAQNQLLMQQAGMTNMPQPKPSNVMPIRRLSNGRNVCPVCAISHETTVAARSCCAGKQAKPKKKASRTNVTPIRPLRTPQEIQAQLEARYAEMEAEAERLRIHALTACGSCRWSKGAWCNQPLVIGIKQDLVLNMDRYPQGAGNICGPEKALWEPIPTRWQRFMEWLAKVIERMEGSPPLATRHRKG